MSISLVSSFLGAVAGLTGTDSTRQNSPSASKSLQDTARSDIDQIRERGLTEWAREQKMEALKEKLRAEILSEKGLTEQGVSGLSGEQRTSIEDEIARMIQQKMEEAMQQRMQEAVRGGKTEAVLLDIVV